MKEHVTRLIFTFWAWAYFMKSPCQGKDQKLDWAAKLISLTIRTRERGWRREATSWVCILYVGVWQLADKGGGRGCGGMFRQWGQGGVVGAGSQMQVLTAISCWEDTRGEYTHTHSSVNTTKQTLWHRYNRVSSTTVEHFLSWAVGLLPDRGV